MTLRDSLLGLLLLSISISTPATAQIENTATLYYDTSFSGTAQRDSETVVSTVVVSADLGLSASSNPSFLYGESMVTVTVEVENFGPSNSTGSDVVLEPPAGTSFASSVDGCFDSGDFVECPVDPLAVSATTSRSFVLNVPAVGTATLELEGSVNGLDTDGDSGNDSVTLAIGYAIFLDGFESGNTSAWSATVP